jgi:hypothetical protein
VSSGKDSCVKILLAEAHLTGYKVASLGPAQLAGFQVTTTGRF